METKLLVIAVQTAERAEIISARLRSEGIDCMLDSVGSQIDPLYSGVKVLVTESDLPRAMEILSSLSFEHGSDKPLVEKSQDEIVTIAVSTWQKAVIMHELLEAANIPSALLNVNLVQPDVSAGVKLRVNEADVEAAMNIISEVDDEEETTSYPEYAMGEILVPVDFSESSITAGRMAAKLAAEAGVPMRLLHVHYTPLITAMPFEEATYSMQASAAELFRDTALELQENMDKLCRLIETKTRPAFRPLTMHHTIIKGLAPDAILDFAAHHNSGMIVLNKGLFEDRTGLFMGSVSGKIAERAQVPVMVLPNEFAFDGLFQIKQIAYAPSFSEADHKALRRLWATTRYFAAKYHFLHISFAGEAEMDALLLKELAAEFRSISGREVECHSLESPDLLRTFNQFVKDMDISLLAMTTHRRNALTALFYPSLTRRVLLHSSLPMMVFHA